MRVRGYLLGEFRVVVDDRLVDMTAGRRGRTMLAYLFAHREAAVTRDALIEAFWPDARPDAALNSLHVALSAARRMLRAVTPVEIIERRHGAYRLGGGAEVWTDVDEFESLCRTGRHEEAALLLRGDFLADEAYANWASSRRETVRALALEVQSRLVALHIARGDFGMAATLARRVLADDPCNEDVHRGLMLCYAGTGLRHLALLHYRQVVTVLWDTLQVRPTSETVSLYARLRRPESLPRPA